MIGCVFQRVVSIIFSIFNRTQIAIRQACVSLLCFVNVQIPCFMWDFNHLFLFECPLPFKLTAIVGTLQSKKVLLPTH